MNSTYTRPVTLGLLLFLLWWLLSGKTSPLLLSLGAASAAGIALFTWRIGVLDAEALPLRLLRPRHGAWRYWLWLSGEIIRANLAVTRWILAPPAPLRPRLFWIPSGQATDLARALYANSITLTPGTVTVDMSGDRLLVHALDASMCDSLAEMSRRIRALDDESNPN